MMSKTIKLDHITKIEGHASLHIKVDNGKVEKVDMKILEGARYFEGILLDKPHENVPQMVSRICGFCSQIHQITALQAIENALNIKVSEYVSDLRESIILASTMQSHALHLLFFALPDYMGYESAIAMAKDHPEYIKKALEVKLLSDNVCRTIGGRALHTLTPVVGGFTRFPTKEEGKALIKELDEAKEKTIWMAELFDGIDYPSFEREKAYAALVNGSGYPFLRGDVKSNTGDLFGPHNYHNYIDETFYEDSTAKRATIKGKEYAVGALARININKDNLSKDAKQLMLKLRHKFPNNSPYMNNVAQAIENVHAIDRLKELLEKIDGRKEAILPPGRTSGRGVSITEAPRGTLIHDYMIDNGRIEKARIITPTVQLLDTIEKDVEAFLPTILDKKENEIKFELEKLIRSYDPCISCSAHFLEVIWE